MKAKVKLPRSTYAQPQTPRKQSFRFMDVPPEIRNLVYSLALPIEPYKLSHQSSSAPCPVQHQASPFALAQVSRQIRYEFRPLFLRHVEMQLSIWDIENYVDMLIQTQVQPQYARVQPQHDGTSPPVLNKPPDYTELLGNMTMLLDPGQRSNQESLFRAVDFKQLLLVLIGAPAFRFQCMDPSRRYVKSSGSLIDSDTCNWFDSETWKDDNIDTEEWMNFVHGAVEHYWEAPYVCKTRVEYRMENTSIPKEPKGWYPKIKRG